MYQNVSQLLSIPTMYLSTSKTELISKTLFQVMYFSTRIFINAGLSNDSATYATLGMGAINVLMTVVSLVLVEKAGRKTLLLIGFSGMAVDTVLLTIGMAFAVSFSLLRTNTFY